MNSKAFKFFGFLVLVVILSSMAETSDIEKKDKESDPVEDEKSRGYCYRGCCVRGLLGRCKKCCAYDGQPQVIVADDDDQPMAHLTGSKAKEITGTDATTEEANHSGAGGHGGGKGGDAGGHRGGKGGGREVPGKGW
ncbi:late embryogenesis abundant protein M17-like [Ziziphus jujuba]|uniref:Late embryogenesis abundant protein M17-like n=1 Tax=Ziziphus jujuba TaxID=326968 RepID=A0ABM4A674_ZIZJJ|nr:late embryogenesis abundant protein M17-like [Ziziphus jujuba]